MDKEKLEEELESKVAEYFEEIEGSYVWDNIDEFKMKYLDLFPAEQEKYKELF